FIRSIPWRTYLHLHSFYAGGRRPRSCRAARGGWPPLLQQVPETTSRRRALQIVYIPGSAARISQQEHLDVFGSEGKDVTC
ncbi:MAG TPA: hypothetical protein VGP33_02655, partial [Chloroflexota bacterium]|nr:hypothetical protein [Chloroflexota bacterium]